ncbi:MAG: DNA polymerase III subunit alpha, partial [Planctomycetota bacterium]
MVRPFVHTHVHSDYSLLDGAAKIPALVGAAARFDQPALALTDHGNLCGAIEFYRACKKKGVKPIIGIEAYLAPRSRRDRERNPVAAHHLILLAQNETGYRNLIKLSTRSFTEGFYYVPRIDKELLSELNEGLIAQSACLSGEPSYYARHDDLARATQAAVDMRDIFGDRYYLELQRNGCDGQEKVNQALLKIGAENGIPVVATNDIHYVEEGDAPAHEVHMCIGMGKTLNDGRRLKPESLLCFRASEPMYSLFADMEEAARHTEQIADRCHLELNLDTLHLPAFEAPNGEDNTSYFRRLCLEGAEKRYGCPLPEAVRRRLEHEQRVIEQMGFVAYFLITWDFVRFARREGIPVGPGRGSAAGSIVAYSLGITAVDPLRYDLLFERFLNPDRISMPDIDIDFCKDGRERVIRYVQEKYGGPDRVSQIITFGRMAARAVIRDVRERGVHAPDRRGAPAGRDEPQRQQARGGGGHRRRASRGVRPALQGGEGPHDAVQHGRARADRPPEDGLPRVADADHSREDAREHPRVRSDAAGPRRPPAGRSRDVRHALRGRGTRHLPARVLRHARPPATDPPDPLRGTLHHPRAVPPRSHGIGHDGHVHRAQARPGARHLPAPVARERPGRNQGGRGLPGAGDAHRQRPGGPGALRSGQPPQGDGQEEAGAARPVPGAVHRGMRRQGHASAEGRGDLDATRALRGVRIQQEPHRRVCGHHLPDGVPQAALPAGVHGGSPDVRDGRHGQGHGVRGRSGPNGDRGAAARHQRFRGRLPGG